MRVLATGVTEEVAPAGSSVDEAGAFSRSRVEVSRLLLVRNRGTWIVELGLVRFREEVLSRALRAMVMYGRRVGKLGAEKFTSGRSPYCPIPEGRDEMPGKMKRSYG